MLPGDFILISEVEPKRDEKDNAKSSGVMPEWLSSVCLATCFTVVIPLTLLLGYSIYLLGKRIFGDKPKPQVETNTDLTQNNGSGDNKELPREK